MLGKINRRGVIKGAGAAGVLGISSMLVQGTGTPTAAADVAAVAGTWEVNITFPDNPGQKETALFAFTADGFVIEANTTNVRTGLGTWRPSDTGFTFAIRELTVNSSGTFLFELRITATGVLTSDTTFTAQGTGQAIAPDGTLLQTVTSVTTATRYGITG